MPYMCEVCGDVFPREREAVYHEMRHRGELKGEPRGNPGPAYRKPKRHRKHQEMISQFISEEIHAGRPREQAIAIGMSRARKEICNFSSCSRKQSCAKCRLCLKHHKEVRCPV